MRAVHIQAAEGLFVLTPLSLNERYHFFLLRIDRCRRCRRCIRSTRGGILLGGAVAERFECESWPRTFLKQSPQQWGLAATESAVSPAPQSRFPALVRSELPQGSADDASSRLDHVACSWRFQMGNVLQRRNAHIHPNPFDRYPIPSPQRDSFGGNEERDTTEMWG